MKRWFAFVLLLPLIVRHATAHEVRPAYLEFRASADGTVEVLWKQPVMGEIAVHLVPHLSMGWLERAPDLVQVTSSFEIKRWTIPSGGASALEGQRVSIDGLENTITDALVVVHTPLLDWQTILTPSHTSQALPFSTAQSAPALPAFLKLGFEHILTGTDHLLFLLALVLILRDRWMLLKALTAFTVAHSITLGLATLHYLQAPVSWIEVEIALSILFLASETVRAHDGGTSLTIRHPWGVAFLFGLLHGFGFAGGLSATGLPSHDVVAALLLFNVGVELGQLAFVAAVLGLLSIARVVKVKWPRPLELIPNYAVGSFAALWTVQRVASLLSGAP